MPDGLKFKVEVRMGLPLESISTVTAAWSPELESMGEEEEKVGVTGWE